MILCLILLLLAGAPASEEAPDDPPAVTMADALAMFRSQDFAGAAKAFEAITKQEPDNARAWMLLGFSYHRAGELDKALPAHLKAAGFDQTASNGMYNTAAAYSLKGEKEKAFEWLGKLSATGKFDMTGLPRDADFDNIKDDPRFKAFMPGPEAFKRPFVEKSRIIQEWDGEAAGDQFGWIARNIGDVDGDGINDVTTSAPSAESGAGRVYVYSSKTGKLLWKHTGQEGEQLGLGIEAAGDTDADGIPDVVAGAPGGDRAYVFSGRDGKILMTLDAAQKGETFGRKVSDVGDFDGDGHDDVLVGAPGNDEAGEDAGRAAVYSGKDGKVLWSARGEKAGDQFGSAAGGRIGPRHKLLVVGAPGAGDSGKGRVYVYTGGSQEPAFVIEADETGVQLGAMFVSVVGDVNGDGVPDVYGSDWPNAAKGRSTGRVYIHSGKDGSHLLTLTGEAAGDGFGIGPADAGDVNKDGHDDLIIGAWQHAGAAPSGGKTYLFSGKDGSVLRAWTCRVMGDTFGFDATGMGDVDGDGTIDFLITSAWSAINGSRSGRMFILSGRTEG